MFPGHPWKLLPQLSLQQQSFPIDHGQFILELHKGSQDQWQCDLQQLLPTVCGNYK